MARRSEIKSKYGKLTVIGEETIKSRRYAVVTCKCGASKKVLADALRSGRTRSCGSYECKHGHKRMRAKRDYNPSGSRTIPAPKLRSIWKAFNDPRNKKTIVQLSVDHEVENLDTLYSTLRAIRRCGGYEEYARRVNT